MSISQELYKELILEHSQNPSHCPNKCGHLSNPTVVQEGVNRSCGDEVELEILIEGDKISSIRVESRGCSISLASGSMMADAVEGMSIREARHLIERFKAMIITGEALNLLEFEKLGEIREKLGELEVLEDLEAFRGVHKYPIRVKCATLVWSTLEQALNQSKIKETYRYEKT